MPSSFSSNFFDGSSPVALVAGGAGFIGSHVCERLLEKNVKVICVDNWLTGLRDNVAHINNPNFCLIESDITKKITRRILRLDYVLHLAGIEAFLNGEDISIETLEANSVGAKNLLDLSIKTSAKFLLGSSIEIYSAHLSSATITNYFGATRAQEGEYSHHEAKRFAEALVAEFAEKKGVDTRIVRIGNVFGPRMILATNNYISRLFRSALYKQSLKVPRSSQNYIYPVFISDLVEGIVKSLLSSGTRNSIISLAGPKTTLFTFAESIKNAKPELIIDYVEDKADDGIISAEVLSAGRDRISWEAKTSLQQGINETLDWLEKNKQRTTSAELKNISNSNRGVLSGLQQTIRKMKNHNESVEIPQLLKTEEKTKTQSKSFWGRKEEKTSPRTKNKTYIFGLIFLLGFLFWLFALPVFELATGLYALKLAKENMQKGDPDATASWAARSGFFFNSAQKGFEQWRAVPGLKNESLGFARDAKLLDNIASLAKKGAGIYKKGKVFAKGFVGDNSFAVSTLAGELSLDLASIERDMSFLEAEMNGEDLVINIPLVGKKELLVNSELAKSRKLMSATAKILGQAGDLFGEKEKKTYLVLFQNNSELRPTGGFIGSFGLVSFDKGRMSNFEVQEVYTADGQLKGHVDSPEAINKYLNEGNWYLRDSNWNPDFPQSAARASWFIDKELGQKVDGVIALDLEFAKALLAGTGELDLPDYNDKVNANNLYEKAQTQAEGNFFPGSHAKKNYLTAISRSLVKELTNNFDKDLGIIFQAAIDSFDKRHLAVWTTNQNVNSVLRQNGWDGSVRSVTCPPVKEKQCTTDYLSVIEANLGVNKSNYFLDRSASLDAVIGNGKILHTLTITYKNNSQAGVWPGGDYKNYLRLYTAAGSQISSAVLTDAKTSKEEKLDINQSEEKGKIIFGMLANTPAGEIKELKIKWETPLLPGFKTDGSAELLLLWQKQAGTVSDPASIRVSLPQGRYKVAANPVPSLTAEGSIGYNANLAKDILLDIAWQPKNTY